MFGQPRFGLVVVVLMLFLVGLFPQQANAEDEDQAQAPTGSVNGSNVEASREGGENRSPEAQNKTSPGGQNKANADSSPDTNSTGFGNTSPANSSTGNNGTGVQCYVCTGTIDSDCIVSPSPDTQSSKDCPSGFCYAEIHHSTQLATLSKRDCATEAHVQCLQDNPDMTSNFPDILGKYKEDWNELISCYGEDPTKYGSTGNTRILELDEIHVDSNPIDNVIVFVCNSSLCTSSGWKVGRDQGVICAVVAVAALLMTSKVTSGLGPAEWVV